jgi:hypothetical protein
LTEAKKDEEQARKDKRQQQEKNKAIEIPLEIARTEKIALLEKQMRHKETTAELETTQSEIIGNQGRYKELEWEYEVKL